MFKTIDLIAFIMKGFEYQIYNYNYINWKRAYSPDDKSIHYKLDGFNEFICNDLMNCDDFWFLQCFTNYADGWCKDFMLVYIKGLQVKLFYLSKSTLNQISITNPDWWIAIDPPPSEKVDLSDSASLDIMKKFLKANKTKCF